MAQQPTVLIYGTKESFKTASVAPKVWASKTPTDSWALNAVGTFETETFGLNYTSNMGVNPGHTFYHSGLMPDGKVCVASENQTNNPVQPTSNHGTLYIFDPYNESWQTINIPTSAGYYAVVNPNNNVVGGVDFADLQALANGEFLAMVSGSYFNWDLGTYGEYPIMSILNRNANDGSWYIGRQYTAAMIAATNPTAASGIYTSTAGTNGNYTDCHFVSEVAQFPVSRHVVYGHYLPSVGSQCGAISIVDPSNGTLKATFKFPSMKSVLFPNAFVESQDNLNAAGYSAGDLWLAPREFECDPSSGLNDERFSVILDTYPYAYDRSITGISVGSPNTTITVSTTGSLVAGQTVYFKDAAGTAKGSATCVAVVNGTHFTIAAASAPTGLTTGWQATLNLNPHAIQEFSYNASAGTITAKTVPFTVTMDPIHDYSDNTNHTPEVGTHRYDQAGNMYLTCTGIYTLAPGAPMAVFKKVGGERSYVANTTLVSNWQNTQYGKPVVADYYLDGPGQTSQVAYSFDYDPATLKTYQIGLNGIATVVQADSTSMVASQNLGSPQQNMQSLTTSTTLTPTAGTLQTTYSFVNTKLATSTTIIKTGPTGQTKTTVPYYPAFGSCNLDVATVVGRTALLMKSTFTNPMSALTRFAGLQVGRQYRIRADFLTAATARKVELRIDFYDANNVHITRAQRIATISSNDGTGAWVTTETDFDTPDNTSYTDIQAYVPSSVVGEIHYLSNVTLQALPFRRLRVIDLGVNALRSQYPSTKPIQIRKASLDSARQLLWMPAGELALPGLTGQNYQPTDYPQRLPQWLTKINLANIGSGAWYSASTSGVPAVNQPGTGVHMYEQTHQVHAGGTWTFDLYDQIPADGTAVVCVASKSAVTFGGLGSAWQSVVGTATSGGVRTTIGWTTGLMTSQTMTVAASGPFAVSVYVFTVGRNLTYSTTAVAASSNSTFATPILVEAGGTAAAGTGNGNLYIGAVAGVCPSGAGFRTNTNYRATGPWTGEGYVPIAPDFALQSAYSSKPNPVDNGRNPQNVAIQGFGFNGSGNFSTAIVGFDTTPHNAQWKEPLVQGGGVVVKSSNGLLNRAYFAGDSNVYWQTQSDGNAPSWGAPQSLGGPTVRYPAIGDFGNGQYSVFCIDSQGRLQERRYDGKNWASTWVLRGAPPGGLVNITATSFGTNSVAVIGFGQDRPAPSGGGIQGVNVYSLVCNNGTWGTWTNLGGANLVVSTQDTKVGTDGGTVAIGGLAVTNAAPAVCSTGTGNLELFYAGAAAPTNTWKCFRRSYNGAVWGAWTAFSSDFIHYCALGTTGKWFLYGQQGSTKATYVYSNTWTGAKRLPSLDGYVGGLQGGIPLANKNVLEVGRPGVAGTESLFVHYNP